MYRVEFHRPLRQRPEDVEIGQNRNRRARNGSDPAEPATADEMTDSGAERHMGNGIHGVSRL